MIDTYSIRPPFTSIYLLLLLLFSQPHVLFDLYTYPSFLLLPASPFSSFKIFSHMKLLAQLPCLLFYFFTAFFSNSVCLLLDFPFIQGQSQNLKLGGAALLLVVCSDFSFRLRCYLVA